MSNDSGKAKYKLWVYIKLWRAKSLGYIIDWIEIRNRKNQIYFKESRWK